MYEFMEKNMARMYSKMLLGLPSLMYLLFWGGVFFKFLILSILLFEPENKLQMLTKRSGEMTI
jgi:hypothetical protein